MFFFCSSNAKNGDYCSEILRTLTLQLLRAHLDLLPYVAEKYAYRGLAPSLHYLRRLISELLGSIPSARVVLDGLDECQESDQKLILQELVSLCMPTESHCKVLISSREVVRIKKTLHRMPSVSLTENRKDVEADIRLFVQEGLADLRHRFDDNIIESTGRIMVQKAEGKS